MTKMTKQDKQDRKELKHAFPNVELFGFADLGITVGIERTGETMGRFAVAIAADDEPRFRRKVGELVVLQRFEFEQTLPVRLFGGMPLEHIAEILAEAVA